MPTDVLSDEEVGIAKPLSDADVGLGEAASPFSNEDALKFGINFSSSVPSMLDRALASGAEGSEMGRQQAADMRKSIPQLMSEGGKAESNAWLSGIEQIPATVGKVGGGLIRTGLNLVNPETWLPPEEQTRPFVISPEGIGQMSPEEAFTRRPGAPGVPLVQFPRTQLQPNAEDGIRAIESLTTPENIALLATGGVSKVAGAALLGTMAPGILKDVTEIAGGDLTPDQKRDKISGLVVPILIGLRHMKPEAEMPTETIPTTPEVPNAISQQRPAEVPVQVPPGNRAPVVEGVSQPGETPGAQGAVTITQGGGETPVQTEVVPTAAEDIQAAFSGLTQGAKEAFERRTKDLVAQQGYVDYTKPAAQSVFEKEHPDWSIEALPDGTKRYRPPTPSPESPTPTPVVSPPQVPGAPASLTPQQLVPALLVNGEPVRGDSHAAALATALSEANTPEEADAIEAAHKDDSNHVFVRVDENGNQVGPPLTRQEAATAVGEGKPLTSERLADLQKAKPVTTATEPETAASEGQGTGQPNSVPQTGEVETSKSETPLEQTVTTNGKVTGVEQLPTEKVKIGSEEVPAESVGRTVQGQPVAPPVEFSTDTAQIGAGNETGAEMYHGTASGLPKSVPDRGPKFSGELLEASRQLGTLVRSRVTLKPGVLGQYVRSRSSIGQNDRIEVGNIRNQLTVAHEMGHDLDTLIWPKVNLARSQRSLEERVPGTPGKALQSELLPISEIMRGPITGTKGHIAYRRSAVELIADFFALYAHDPATARTMAPKFSKGFEDSLSQKPDAAGVIHQLLEGNVEPVPAEQAYKGPAAVPRTTPGKILAKMLPDPVKRDMGAAVAGQDLVKGLVREFESRVQRARVVADRWRKEVPDRNQRNDVGAFVEGIGNIEIPGDTIKDVVNRMTPESRQLAKDYRFAIEAQRNDINAYLKGAEEGEYLKFLEDYLGHFYANVGSQTARSGLSKFMKDSPNAKERRLPTNREAVEMGLIPTSIDPAVIYEHHANVNWRTATNRQLMSELKNMKLSTGDPAVVPAKDAPPGWHITNNPLVQKVYAHQTPNGLMIWKGGAAIHPDVWNSVRQMLDTPVSGDFAKAFDALNGVTRANAFAFSLFHDMTLRFASTGQMFSLANPLRGLARVLERNPMTGELEVLRSTRNVGKELLHDEEAVADAAKAGLKFSWTESESYQHNARDFLEKSAAKLRDVPYLGRTAAVARDIQHMRQEGLWKNTHDAYKIIAYHDAVSKALAGAPAGTDPSIVKDAIARHLNAAFGGQEWQTKFWLSPQLRQAMSRFFLAPDWTLSTLMSVPLVSDVATAARTQIPRLAGFEKGVANYEGKANLKRLKFWGGELAAIATATIAGQYALYSAFGDDRKGDKPWVWENESGNGRRIDITPLMRKLPWHDANDPTRYYVNLGKRPEEILGWFVHPEVNILSKMSRPVAEIFHQITGTSGDFKAPWKQDHETFLESLPERAKSAGSQFIPFVFGGNQFALSVPYRKGMTKYKAQNAYESIYELAADPGYFTRVRSFLRGQQPSEGDLQSMVSEVTDAATRNGVPAEEVRRRALSSVRGHHYDLYFKALKADDQKAADNEAEILLRLGATSRGIRQSIKTHQKLSPQIPAGVGP